MQTTRASTFQWTNRAQFLASQKFLLTFPWIYIFQNDACLLPPPLGSSLNCGVFWPSLQDPSLRLKVPHLLDILLKSCAATTAQKYSSGWQRWKAWARYKLGVSVLPAVPSQVAWYLTELVEHAVRNGHSVSVIVCSTQYPMGSPSW